MATRRISSPNTERLPVDRLSGLAVDTLALRMNRGLKEARKLCTPVNWAIAIAGQGQRKERYDDIAKAVEGIGDVQIEFLLGTIFLDPSYFTILDFGCGLGRLMLGLVWFDPKILSRISYVGVEVNRSHLRMVTRLSRSRKLTLGGRNNTPISLNELLAKPCLIADVDRFKKLPGTYKYAFMVNVLHEMPLKDVPARLALLYQRVERDGYLILHEMETLPPNEMRFPWTLANLQRLFGQVRRDVVFRKIFSKSKDVPIVTVAIKKSLNSLDEDKVARVLLELCRTRLQDLEYKIERFRKMDIYDRLNAGFRGNETAQGIRQTEKLISHLQKEYQELNGLLRSPGAAR